MLIVRVIVLPKSRMFADASVIHSGRLNEIGVARGLGVEVGKIILGCGGISVSVITCVDRGAGVLRDGVIAG